MFIFHSHQCPFFFFFFFFFLFKFPFYWDKSFWWVFTPFFHVCFFFLNSFGFLSSLLYFLCFFSFLWYFLCWSSSWFFGMMKVKGKRDTHFKYKKKGKRIRKKSWYETLVPMNIEDKYCFRIPLHPSGLRDFWGTWDYANKVY